MQIFLHILAYVIGLGILYFLSLQATKIEKRSHSILAYIGIVIASVFIFYLLSIYDSNYLEKTYLNKPVNNIEILNIDNK